MPVIRIDFLKRLPIILIVMLLALAIAPAMVSADDVDNDEVADVVDNGDVTEDEESTFKSPNDVKNLEQKTTNILDAIDNDLAALEADRQEKQDALDAIDDENSDEYAEAEQALEDAEDAYDDRLAEVAGVDADTITQMRKDGDGYGLICHKLGLHPSILGNRYGQMKANQHTVRSRHRNRFGDDGEFSATTRDVKNAGLAKGHNKSAFGKSNGKGKADSFGINNNGKAKGKSNGKGGGKGGGKGNGKDK